MIINKSTISPDFGQMKRGRGSSTPSCFAATSSLSAEAPAGSPESVWGLRLASITRMAITMTASSLTSTPMSASSPGPPFAVSPPQTQASTGITSLTTAMLCSKSGWRQNIYIEGARFFTQLTVSDSSPEKQASLSKVVWLIRTQTFPGSFLTPDRWRDRIFRASQKCRLQTWLWSVAHDNSPSTKSGSVRCLRHLRQSSRI